MTTAQRVQRKQLIREAEGYLELMTLFDGSWPLDIATKQTFAKRALQALEQVKRPLGHKPHLLFLKGQICRVVEEYARAVNYLQQSAQLDPCLLYTSPSPRDRG